MSENLRSDTKALYAMDGVVRRSGHADWDAPSPNREWTARETLGHVIWGVKRPAADIRGETGPLEQPEARHGIHILTAVGDAIRGPGLMDDAIDVHDAAPESDRFIAYTGRDPR